MQEIHGHKQSENAIPQIDDRGTRGACAACPFVKIEHAAARNGEARTFIKCMSPNALRGAGRVLASVSTEFVNHELHCITPPAWCKMEVL